MLIRLGKALPMFLTVSKNQLFVPETEPQERFNLPLFTFKLKTGQHSRTREQPQRTKNMFLSTASQESQSGKKATQQIRSTHLEEDLELQMTKQRTDSLISAL